MIKPTNTHVLIQPLEHTSFIPTSKGIYEEVGVVIDFDDNLEEIIGTKNLKGLKKGDKVYFDAWLAGKFPTGKEEEYFWLVKWADIKAIEDGNEISE